MDSQGTTTPDFYEIKLNLRALHQLHVSLVSTWKPLASFTQKV